MANKKISELLVAAPLTGSEVLPIVQDGQTVQTTAQSIANLASGGSGLEGTNYVYVAGNGVEDIDNGLELLAAYATAQTMSPSETNRITVIVAPGNYNLNPTNILNLNTPYIDVVSLTGNTDVILNAAATGGYNSSVYVSANNVYVKGINTLNKMFYVASNLSNTTIENCIGGEYSFGSHSPNSFGPFNITNTFINCVGGDNSFGEYFEDVVAGTYINCTAGNNSFAGNATGVFKDCTSGNYSFGTNTSIGAAGTFTNCKSGFNSFGSFTTANGTFTNCVAGFSSFGRVASGIFDNCIGGDFSFGSDEASGTFNNCVGGNASWNGTLTGQLYFCRHTFSQTTPTPALMGRVVAFISGGKFIAENPLTP